MSRKYISLSFSRNRKVKSSHSSCNAAPKCVSKSNFGLTTCSVTVFRFRLHSPPRGCFHDEIPPAASDLLPASLSEAFEDQVDQVVIALCADQIFTARARKLLVAPWLCAVCTVSTRLASRRLQWPQRGAQHQLHCCTSFLPLSQWCRDSHKTLSSMGPQRVQPWDKLRPLCPSIGAVLLRRNPVLCNWMLRSVVVRSSSPSVARWMILPCGDGPRVRAHPQSWGSARNMAVSHLIGCKFCGPNNRQHAGTFKFAFTGESEIQLYARVARGPVGSSRATFDTKAADCSSRNLWVACKGAARPGNQRVPRSFLGLRQRRRPRADGRDVHQYRLRLRAESWTVLREAKRKKPSKPPPDSTRPWATADEGHRREKPMTSRRLFLQKAGRSQNKEAASALSETTLDRPSPKKVPRGKATEETESCAEGHQGQATS